MKDATEQLSTEVEGPEEPFLAALRRFRLFDALDLSELTAVAGELEWISLAGGSLLFREGDSGDALYVLTTGRLGIAVDAERERIVAQIDPGETVGEMALISGAPRSATVIALRDCELLRLKKDAFESLIRRYPHLMLRLLALLTERLNQAIHQRSVARVARTVALIPLDPAVSSTELSVQLEKSLARQGKRVFRIESDSLTQATEWFNTIESAHDLVIYCGEAANVAWNTFCLRQSEHILLLIRCGASLAGMRLIEFPPYQIGLRRCEMVILHDDSPGVHNCTGTWAAPTMITARHKVRGGNAEDMDRLARFITGRAMSLVLSGGGARGFAHIGAIRALREAGIPMDILIGTSMGAVVAAGLALEWDNEVIENNMRRSFVETNPLNDYTIPLVALVKGHKVGRLLHERFGDVAIEDLHRMYACVSSNLTEGSVRIHRKGALWSALRASVAIPGLLPPVMEEDAVLVDGGVLNNFPVDIACQDKRGPIIGVNVARDYALTDVSSARSWVSRLVSGQWRGPSIISLLMRAGTVSGDIQTRESRRNCDLVVEPPLQTIDLRDWGAFERVVDIGYRHTVDVLERPPGLAMVREYGNSMSS